MKHKIKRLIQNIAYAFSLTMYIFGFVMFYALLTFFLFKDVVIGHEWIWMIAVVAIGLVSALLLMWYIVKSSEE